MRLQILHADVSYGADEILRDVSFEIHDGQKIAIVGRNGCGKTTLLKLITGELSPVVRDGNDQPQIIKTGDPVIGTLSQISFADENITLGEELRSTFLPLIRMKERMDVLLQVLDTAPDEKTAAEYAALEERFGYLGGYRYEKDYELLFSRFGFTKEDAGRKMSEFSGGQRTKIAFIKLLLTRPDILVLDEPTNHLDISTIAWLEGYLAEYPRAMIVVSHDRYFLDRIADVVCEIERGRLTRYPGNYSEFVRQKKEQREKQQKDYEAQQKEIARLQAVADRFIHKATKASMAKSKLKAIEHMELIEKPESYDLKAFHTLTAPARESGTDVLDVDNLGVGYDTTLANVTFSLKRGQKLGVIGANGQGKSTFLKTIAGKIKQRSGKFRFGHGVESGYFDQTMAQYTSEKNVLNDFWDRYPTLTETEVRNVLGGFLFTGEEVFKKVPMLSGGEKVRLALAKIFQTRPNLLLLDEPTNHMDIVGKEALEEMLRDYEGTLIFVSHDRYLIRQVADSLLIFGTDGVQYFPYDYEEYERTYGREKLQEAAEVWKIGEARGTACGVIGAAGGGAAAVEGKAAAATGGHTDADGAAVSERKKGANPGKERAKAERRVARLEELMEECDSKKAALNERLSDPAIASDYAELSKIQQEIDEINSRYEEYFEEWGTLSELLEE